MTDPETPLSAPGQPGRWLDPGQNNVQLIYFLYLASFAIGITGFIGLVMAYINRGKADAWVETHYTWLIRTFWIGLLLGFISVLLMIVVIGFVLFIAVAVWVIARCIIGLQAANRGEPITNPKSWML